MPIRSTSGFELDSNPDAAPRKATHVGRIVILGDFSGAAPTSEPKMTRHPATLENLDDLMRVLTPTVQLAIEEPLQVSGEITLTSIDDFHPDHLLRALPDCQTLLSIQQRLSSPATESTALAELSALMGISSTQIASSGDDSRSGEETDSSLFQRLLGTPAREAESNQISNKLDQIVQAALENVSVESSSTSATAGQQEILALLTDSTRAVLNLPQLKRLEANWLGIDWLLRRIEDDQADIELMDLSWKRLSSNLQRESGLEDTGLYQSLTATDEARPDLVIGLYSVGRDLDDLSTLAKLSIIAGACGAALATHGDLSLCGCSSPETANTPNNWSLPDDDVDQYWQSLRLPPAAAHLSLLAPRFLLRHPYGAKTDPVETFAFEELPLNPDSDRFCWGNPALIYALCWASGQRQIEELPMPVYTTDSGKEQQPPIEFVLDNHAIEKAGAAGLVILRTNRSTGTVMI